MLETKVELNGKEYTLTYDWDAQIKAEEITKINLLFPQGVSASAIVRATLLARILKNHPEMTLEKVSKLLPTNTTKILNSLNEISEYQESPEEIKIEEVYHPEDSFDANGVPV